jgi:uncharacterized RDD family membrane protein YckC
VSVVPSDIAHEQAPAGFWTRYVALFLDSVWLWPVTFVASLAYEAGRWQAIAGAAALIVLVPVYRVVFHATRGATLGKISRGLKVVRTDGSPVGWTRALRRESVGLVLALAVFTGEVWAIVHVDVGRHARFGPGWSSGWMADYQPWWAMPALVACLVWLLLDALFLVCSKERRAAHDLIGGTVVVREAVAEQALAADVPTAFERLKSGAARR